MNQNFNVQIFIEYEYMQKMFKVYIIIFDKKKKKLNFYLSSIFLFMFIKNWFYIKNLYSNYERFNFALNKRK